LTQTLPNHFFTVYGQKLFSSKAHWEADTTRPTFSILSCLHCDLSSVVQQHKLVLQLVSFCPTTITCKTVNP